MEYRPLTADGRTRKFLNCRHYFIFIYRSSEEERTMKWTTPRIVEVAVGLEINSYACAELK
jgi:coenzyme PQQ precursor peptide PqqA